MKKELLHEEDRKIEIILGNLLRTGVIIAAIIVIAGGIIYLIRHGFELPHYTVFKGEPGNIKDVISVIKGALALESISIIQLGILVLIATPVLRVVFSVVAFIYEKDLMYVIFTLIVLAVLIFSLWG